MKHVVYLDKKSEELEKLLAKEKTMVIRGAMGRKLPYGRVDKNDTLCFINNNAEGVLKAKAKVKSVLNSEKLSKEDSAELVKNHQAKLKLTDKQFARWAGKRYLVLIEVSNIETIEEIVFDKSKYNTMDDWIIDYKDN